MLYDKQIWVDGSIDAPAGPTSAARFNHMEQGIADAQATADAATPLGTSTSLPTGVEGAQTLLYSTQNTGSLWFAHFHSSTWWVVAAAPILSTVESGTSFGADSGAAWHDPISDPAITIPFSGIYVVRWGANLSSGAQTTLYKASLQLNGAGAGGTDDYVSTTQSSGGSGPSEAVVRSKTKTFAAGDTLSLIYHSEATSGTNYAEHRFIEVTPVTLS